MREAAGTSAVDTTVLGVERSVTGKSWRARGADGRAALALAQRLELPEIVGRVLAARGVGLDDAARFLNPTLRECLPDPSALRDMDAAVARLVQAITSGETVAVFGDYDVDGATATAILARFFASLGRPLPVYIPDRMTEGYGPNPEAMRKLAAAGATVVVTVDCGTAAFEALEAAADAGLDVIVIDHHVAEARLPPALAVVNPNRLDEDGTHGALCAAGVTFLLVVALNRALRDAYWYGEGHPEPDLMGFLDLVALGTVCDVVPLTGVNRALVAQGLKIMARRANAGIAALADAAGLSVRPDAYHAGFVFGPRVNAGGRVGEAGLGARLLATDDPAEAAALALRLERYNAERQQIEAAVLDAALAAAEDQVASGAAVIVVSGEGWHPGVIGIVAGRLRERFDRPALVVATADGVGRGSGRSVPGIALGPAVIAARQAGILVNGGGHAMAAGFTIAADRLAELRAFLEERVLAEAGGALPLPVLSLDGALTAAAATRDLVETLDRVGPFGAGNPRPRFAFAALRVAYAEPVGADHVRVRLADATGGPQLNAIAFRAAGSELGRALMGARGGALHVAGNLRLDDWQGRAGCQLVVEDAASAGAGAA
jgi:single-stranded-DNA-specific exonuclease